MVTRSRRRPNALLIDRDHAEIALPGGHRIKTTCLQVGRYIRINDGRQYPHLCVGAERQGNTLEYVSPAVLAADCRATLYKTRRGFERAVARLAGECPA